MSARGDVHRERGFTIIELIVVITVLAVVVGAATVAFYGVSRRADVSAATEMVKQDLRNVYALANSGERTPASTPLERINSQREQYRITFNTTGENPENAYLVEKRLWNGSAWGAWGAVAVPIQPAAANRIVTVSGKQWIRPSSSGDTVINYHSNKVIYFISKGSIVWTGDPGGDPYVTGVKRITVSSPSQGKSIDIYVSPYGSISEG